MVKLPMKPWGVLLLPSIGLLIAVIIYHGIFEMTKQNSPASPLGVPAQADPYEYNWQLETQSTRLTYHKGGEKKGLVLMTEYVQSRHSDHMYTAFYDRNGNVVRTLEGPGLGGEIVSPKRWQLPASMYLTYYSWIENQFYQLETDLPIDAFKEAFDEITLDFRPPNLYSDPAFGSKMTLYFGPEGRVLFFVTNASHTSHRIVARYQAKKIDGSYIKDVRDDGQNSYFYPDENGSYPEKFSRDNLFAEAIEASKRDAPPYYEIFKAGKGMPAGSGKWIDDIQIKYPWKLELIDPTGEWLGEYTVNYISGEWDTVLRDRLPEQVHALKPIPSSIRTWVYDKPTGQRYFIEIDTYARIKENWSRNGLRTIYKNPNVDYLRKRFEYFFPSRAVADNNTPAKSEDFATLKIILDNNGKMSEIYLEKNGTKLPLDGAYHYYLAPVQEDGYLAQEGFDRYITEPKVNLIDPEIESMD